MSVVSACSSSSGVSSAIPLFLRKPLSQSASAPTTLSPLATKLGKVYPPSNPMNYYSPLLKRCAKAMSSGKLDLAKANSKHSHHHHHNNLQDDHSSTASSTANSTPKSGRKAASSNNGTLNKRHDYSSEDSSLSPPLTPSSPNSNFWLDCDLDRTRSPGVNHNDEDVNCTVFEVEEYGSKRWIRVEVIEPVVLTAKNFLLFNTSFTTYLIRIETNHYAFSLPISEVRRRYSEFVWLRKKLGEHHPNKVLPPLPPKHYFNIINFNQGIINQRRHGLGKFLQRVFRSTVLLSDSALHLFLQTNLTTKEIDARICEEGSYHPSANMDGSGDSHCPNKGGEQDTFPMTTAAIAIGLQRPYLFRSTSSSSDASGVSGSHHHHHRRHAGSDESDNDHDHDQHHDDDEKYCAVSSSDEFEVNVES